MRELLVFGLGVLGTWIAVTWLSQTEAMWRKVARISILCAILGAALTYSPNAQTSTAAWAIGLVGGVTTPVALILPLPKLHTIDDLRNFARHTATWLSIASFYGTVFALLGSIAIQIVWNLA
jgi:hypothetical protein